MGTTGVWVERKCCSIGAGIKIYTFLLKNVGNPQLINYYGPTFNRYDVT